MDFSLEDLFAEPPPKIRVTDTDQLIRHQPKNHINHGNGSDINYSTNGVRDSKFFGKFNVDETRKKDDFGGFKDEKEPANREIQGGNHANENYTNLTDLFAGPPPKVMEDCNENNTANISCDNYIGCKNIVPTNDFTSNGFKAMSENVPIVQGNKQDFYRRKKKNNCGNKGRKHHSKCRVSVHKMNEFIQKEHAANDIDFFGEPVIRTLPQKRDLDWQKEGKQVVDERDQQKLPQINPKLQINNSISSLKPRNKKKRNRNRNKKKLIDKKKEPTYVDNTEDSSIVLPPRVELNPHKWPVCKKIADGTANIKLNSMTPSIEINSSVKGLNRCNEIKFGHAEELSHSVVDDILSKSKKSIFITKSNGNLDSNENMSNSTLSSICESESRNQKSDLLKMGRQPRISRCAQEERNFVFTGNEAENVSTKLESNLHSFEAKSIGRMKNFITNRKKLAHKICPIQSNNYKSEEIINKCNINEKSSSCIADHEMLSKDEEIATDSSSDKPWYSTNAESADDLVIHLDEGKDFENGGLADITSEGVGRSSIRKKIKCYNVADSESDSYQMDEIKKKIYIEKENENFRNKQKEMSVDLQTEYQNSSLGVSADTCVPTASNFELALKKKFTQKTVDFEGNRELSSIQSSLVKDKKEIYNSRKYRLGSSNTGANAVAKENNSRLAVGKNHSLLHLLGADTPVDLAVAFEENTKESNAGNKDRPKRGGKKKKIKKKGDNRKREFSKNVTKEKRLPAKCKYFKDGKCRMGQDCNFLHEGKPERRELCKYYVINSCILGDDCMFMHNEFPCKFYHAYSSCNHGDNCKFSHQPLTDETQQLLQQTLSREDTKQSEDVPKNQVILDVAKLEKPSESENPIAEVIATQLPPLYAPLPVLLGESKT